MEPEKSISSATMDPSIQTPEDGTSKPALEDKSLEQITDGKNTSRDAEAAGPEQDDATEKSPLDVPQPKKKKKKNRKPKSKRGQVG